MNKLKKQIFLAMIVLLLPFIGVAQTLTLDVDNNSVCQGETVTFTATAHNILGQVIWHALYKDDIVEPIIIDSTSQTTKTYNIVAEESAYYTAKIGYTNNFLKEEITSNQVALTVNKPTSSSFNMSACDSFEWHGSIYDESGIYVFDTLNTFGCAHTDTLHLVVFHSTESFETITGCDSYIWHGSIYNESGDYIFDTINSNGCDSIMHLNLTINKSPEIEIYGDAIVCDNSESYYTTLTGNNDDLSYQWEIAGGTIVGTDSTETITVQWNKPTAENKVSVMVANKNTGCFTNVEKKILIQSFVNESLNKIVAKKNSNGIPYILIYPNPSSDYYYQWYKNDEPVEGETGQYLYLNENLSANIDSVYRVYVGHISDGNSLVCGKYTDYYVNNQAKTNNVISVSPNPVNGNEGINIYMDYRCNCSSVKIYSPEGKVVFSSEITGNPMKINVNFPKGLYIIEVVDNQDNKNFEKIIVK